MGVILGLRGKLLHRLLVLGIAQLTITLLNLLLSTQIGRQLGVESLGIFALAQGILQYVVIGTDLGFRSIGSRLIAIGSGHVAVVIQRIQRQRSILLGITLILALAYVFWGPIPEKARWVVGLFVLSTFPGVFALDWVWLGQERFTTLALWRMLGPVVLVGGTLWVLSWGGGLAWIALMNFLSLGIGGLLSWWVLTKTTEIKPTVYSGDTQAIRQELAWSNVMWLGFAQFANQLAHSADILLLGALTSPTTLGVYGASYRIVSLVMGGFYLVTQAIYPWMARLSLQHGSKGKIFQATVLLVLLSIPIVGIGVWTSPWIIHGLYGQKFSESVPILRVLWLVIPVEFACAFLGTVLTAWAKGKQVLLVTVVGALSSLALNLYLIPRYGAMGAAWSNVIANVTILAALGIIFVLEARYDRNTTTKL